MGHRVGALMVIVAATVFSSTALAQPWNPVGRTDKKGNPGVAVIPENVSPFRPDDAWTDALARRIYNSDLGPAWLNRPLEFMYPLYDWGMNDFDNRIAEDIASGCRNKYPGDSWRQISCASIAVEMLLDHHDLWQGARSPCRSHQRAFAEVVDRLDIPGVRVGAIAMPGHVLNRLFVTTPTGQVFQYAVDVGWNEDRIYPHNDAARRFHDRNGDGTTDHFELPPIPTRGQRIDYSFRPAPPREGSNVGRNTNTTGGVATSPTRVGTASGAGILRD